MMNIRLILETYGQKQLEPYQTFQTSNTLDTDSRSIYFPDTLQPLALPIQYHNEFRPMSSQKRATITHAAVMSFFCDLGIISSILQMVHPTQQQTQLNSHSNSQIIFRYWFQTKYPIHNTTHITFKNNIYRHQCYIIFHNYTTRL